MENAGKGGTCFCWEVDSAWKTREKTGALLVVGSGFDVENAGEKGALLAVGSGFTRKTRGKGELAFVGK